MANFSGANYVGNFDASRLIANSKTGAERGLAKAAAFLTGEIKKSLSMPGPYKKRRTGMIYKLAKSLGGEQVEVRASAPGEPPRYRSRDLLNSVRNEKLDDLVWRIGSHLLYSLWLELGTVAMKARPFLRVALRRFQAQISAIILREVAAAHGR